MQAMEIMFGEVDTAIAIMRKVSAWGRNQGYRVWLDEWLTREELLGEEVQEENFCIGKIGNDIVCAFILQWSDKTYWKESDVYKAAYLHKFCVRREFAHQNITKTAIVALQKECKKRDIKYIRLDMALDEKVVRKIYLDAGFKIVDIIDYDNGRSLALYEMEV